MNIIPLGSYDYPIDMDWLEKYHVVLDSYNRTITFLDKDGKQSKIQSILRATIAREISTMQLKKKIRKGCQIFAACMEEVARDNVASIEDLPVLGDFEDVFGKILEPPPKRDIDFATALVA
jgi:hypothetical protein